ncbi:hypothetical protein BASA81_012357 [Batrachochytrium salamandrivorans]|nr:hypothetical protein BASA81_012357 [Batrachochytrium salamandrivorans]
MLLTGVNLLNYMDRGLVAGAGTMIKGCVASLDECSAASRRAHEHNECDGDDPDDVEVPGCSARCRVCGTKCRLTDETVEQTGFGINDFDLGIVQSSFMVGYMVGSFVFSSLASQEVPIYRLLAVGMSIWTISALVCAFSGWYGSVYWLWLGRVGSGVGEAALATTVLPHLDDVVPELLKGRSMSIYFSALPVGTALGFVFAGVVSESLSWEWTFFLEALLMPPFILVFWCAPGLQGYVISRLERGELMSQPSFILDTSVNMMEDSENNGDLLLAPTSPNNIDRNSTRVGALQSVVWKEVMLCLKSSTFLLTVMGLGMYTFTTAGLAFYMPQYLQHARPCDKRWKFTNKEADMAFGAMAMVAGFFGVLLGGIVLDYMSSTSPDATSSSSQVANALKIGFFQLVVATGLLFCAIFVSNVVVFFLLSGVGVFVVFSTTTPSSRALLSAVPTEARPTAMALSNLLVHLFGDVPSPVLIGAVSDSYSPRSALLVAWLGLVAACVFWFAGWASAVAAATGTATAATAIERRG